MPTSKRFEALSKRPVNMDGFVTEWPEAGIVAMESPYDPVSSIRLENDVIVEMDRKKREDFDFIDTFIADYAIDRRTAVEAAALDSVEMARRLVDIHADRKDISRLVAGMTPAKLCEVLRHMNVVEMMMAMQKMRERSYPANQCHVTNLRDNPIQIACDAAEAALRRVRGGGNHRRHRPVCASVCSGAAGGIPMRPSGRSFPVRGGGSHRADAGDAGANHLRGNHFGVRNGKSIH